MGLLYTPALAERAQAWLNRPLTTGPEGRRSEEGLLELASIWAAIHRQPLPACIRQCQYSERHASVAAYLREFSRLQPPDAMSEKPASKYQLAPAYANETLVDEDLAGPVTADTLTDEIAEHFIKKGRKDLFVTSEDAKSATITTAAVATDHAGELAKEQKAHKATTGKLEKEQEAHGKAKDALKAEKDAHKVTHKELTDSKKLLADAEKQLAEVRTKLATATDAAEDASNEAGSDAK